MRRPLLDNHVMMKLVFCSFVIFSSLTYSQNPSPFFKEYSTYNGLPSPEVHSIFQDSRGYMWFGTDNGVARFDGYNFVTYGAAAGLDYNVILNIFEDPQGRIWFSALNGQVFILDSDKIEPYKYNHVVEQYRSGFVDGQLMKVGDDLTASFMLTSCGLLTIDSSGRDNLENCLDLESILVYHDKDISFATNCNCLSTDRSLQNGNSTIFEILAFGKRKQFRIDYSPMKSVQPFSFQLDSSTMIIGYDGVLYFLEDGQLTWNRPEPYKIHDLQFAKNGGIWMGLSHLRGLRFYEDYHALKQNKYQEFLGGMTITSMLEDRDGGLWVASHDSGLFYCSNTKTKIYRDTLGFSSKIVSAIAFKDRQNLFVGLGNGQVISLNLENNQREIIPFSYTGVINHVYDLYYDRINDELWADEERFSKGISNDKVFDTQGWKHFFGRKYHYDSNRQLLWIVKGQGFYSVQPSNATIFPEAGNFTIKQRFFSIYTDINGTVWTGGNNGLAEWRDTILIPVQVDHPAFKQRIEDIDAFNRTHLIFGTKGRGVIIWKEGEIIEVNSSHGLASDMIEDVHVDENNIAWIATFNGLSKITLDALDQPTVRTFTIENGLPSNEIYQIKSFEGQPWLCTGGGLVRWQDPPFEFHSYKPEIRQVWINGASSSFRTDFSHWENNLTIDFLTIDYQQFGQINYRYRLSDSEPWTQSKNPSVSFARLNPGMYHFEIQSQNKDKVWSASTIYPFMIRQPWYATWWFVTMSALALFAIGYFVLNWWNRRKREEDRFKSEMDNLKKSALQAQMNPHFIFNCLNSIQSYINQGKKEDANTYLLNFANLIRGCLNASLEKEISLEQDINFIRNYLDLESMRFTPDFHYEFDIDPVLQPDRILLEPMLILPFVENAVIHGLSRSDRQGQIKISYRLHEDCLHVSIQDNGEGLNRINGASKDHRKHKSVGITITRKRLELLDQNMSDWIRFHDISNGSAVKGTRVDLKIRIKILDIKQMNKESRDIA